MSKIFVSNWITLDGVFSGEDGSTDWFTFDKELEAFNLSTLQPAPTILFGGKTFRMMESFWPTELAKNENPAIVKYMNDAAKHTFSKTLESSPWNNSFFHKELNKETVEQLKNHTPGDIVVLGSGEITMQLQQMGLVDEYNILLDPQIGIGGRQFFKDVPKTSLQLLESIPFNCGVVFLKYKVVK